MPVVVFVEGWQNFGAALILVTKQVKQMNLISSQMKGRIRS